MTAFTLLLGASLLMVSVTCSSDEHAPALGEDGSPSDIAEIDRLSDLLHGDNPQIDIGLDTKKSLLMDLYDRVMSNDNEPPRGAIYTRWGKSSCIQGSELVYSGTTGGSYFSNTGSATNFLCMPSDPIYDEVESTTNPIRAYLYSSEYETESGPTRLRSLDETTPTCAVCRAPYDRMTQLMIPGRNVCPSASWRLEYKGYLMAAMYSHQRKDFICMDRDMEPEPGTEGSQNGALLYFVETRCLSGGGIPCNPYVTGYEVTCAVCTI